jgi:arrestin-related trafficking adapter 1
LVRHTQLRWNIRQIIWRIEEQEKFVSHPCPKHADKVSRDESAASYSNLHVVREGEIKNCKKIWKQNLLAGKIYLDFPCTIGPHKKVAYDISAPDMGISISHYLVLEVIMFEETAELMCLSEGMPTGPSRTVHWQFPITIVDTTGLEVG